MQRAIAAVRRLMSCARRATLVGYTSLMLLTAVAAITMLGHASGGAKPTRTGNVTASD